MYSTSSQDLLAVEGLGATKLTCQPSYSVRLKVLSQPLPKHPAFAQHRLNVVGTYGEGGCGVGGDGERGR
jgi:hypothetical protein